MKYFLIFYFQAAPQVANSNIAAQFAAQVAATLKKEERAAEKAANQNDSEDRQVDSRDVSEVHSENDLTSTVNLDSASSQAFSSEHVAEANSSAQGLSNNVLDSTGEESSKEPKDLSVEKSEASNPITGNEPPSLTTSTETKPAAATTLSSEVQTSVVEVSKEGSVSISASEEKKDVVQDAGKVCTDEVPSEVKPEPVAEVPQKETVGRPLLIGKTQ